MDWSAATNLRRFLVGILWYQAVLIVVVLAHPFRGDVIEWFHRFSYLAGSTLVGWVIAWHGRARQAFRLYLWGSAILSLVTLEHAVALHFQPAQWGVYQKNAIGAVLWVAVVVAQLNPSWARHGKMEARVIEGLCLVGLLATQSRQSAILVVLALGTAALLNSEVRAKAKLVVFIAVPVLGLVYYSFALAFRNNPQFNSVAIRFGQIDAALHVWHQSPWLGLGMRFYNLPQYLTVTAPPNSLVDNLASTGVIGSLAFLFLVVVTMRSMIALPRLYGTLGLVVLLAHYVDGLFDTFWIGALSITPFVIAGISLGMADAHPEAGRVPAVADAAPTGRSAGVAAGPPGRTGPIPPGADPVTAPARRPRADPSRHRPGGGPRDGATPRPHPTGVRPLTRPGAGSHPVPGRCRTCRGPGPGHGPPGPVARCHRPALRSPAPGPDRPNGDVAGPLQCRGERADVGMMVWNTRDQVTGSLDRFVVPTDETLGSNIVRLFPTTVTAVPRLVVNALPLEPVGGGVSTYIRELLGALAPVVRADLVAAVRPSGVQELPVASPP